MIPLNITVDSSDGVTVLSNRFIDQYMKDANDAQIKVYLYLLRMVSANLPTDIAEIADKFNHTEKEVFRALSYWEKLQLLCIDYDDRKNIVGIRLCNPPQAQDHITSAIPAPVVSLKLESSLSAPMQYTSKKEPEIYRMDYTKEKNSYSLEDIKSFKNNPESEQLLFAAQQYLKKTLSGPGIKTLLFIYDRLGFALDLTDYLLQSCISHGQKTFSAIEQTAIQWYEAGITNIKQAKAFQTKPENHADAKLSSDIMKLLGKQGLPAKKEQEYIDLWTIEYSYPMELIEEACNRTVMRTESNRFAYANSILEKWHTKNIHTINDVKADETEQRQSTIASRQTSSVSKKQTGTFCKIEQHDYDFDAMEQALLKKALANHN